MDLVYSMAKETRVELVYNNSSKDLEKELNWIFTSVSVEKKSFPIHVACKDLGRYRTQVSKKVKTGV
jgi:hypothetical protein